jgi:hypothetical protein
VEDLMRRLLWMVVLAGAGVVLAAAPALAQPNGFSVDISDGQLYTVDLATGAATPIGAPSGLTISSLAFSPNGTLFAIDDFENEIVTVNPTTGATTTVGPLGVNVEDTGLTFGADGRLWMTSRVNLNLFEVNPTTGTATLVGPTNTKTVAGLTGECAGTLLGLTVSSGDPTSELVRIDTATGAGTVIGETNVVVFSGGLDFDPAGALFGIDDFESGPDSSRVLSIDPATGAAVVVANVEAGGDPVANLRSLAIAPLSCPAPSAPAPATAIVVEPLFTG